MTESEQYEAANALLLATTTTNDNDDDDDKSSIELPDEISNSFMQYALSIILGRALPDARDGLKPVHRRILYAMDGLGLSPGGSHRKCARVVGEVLGKYHPHGDTAVYDALVRLAQDFSTGTLLIDGHGNFGSIDNDPAAAMRYTECRLTRVASEALLQDVHLDTVDFMPNFDGNEMEPMVLPAKLPLLLLNGCAGIAVGMATNVPPHNLNELMDASIALTQSREEDSPPLADERLFDIVPAPDFPTGASILGTSDARKLYKTGNGGIVVRAITHVEQRSSSKSSSSSSKKNRNAIVITQLPYQVNKAALMEKIATLVNEKKMDGIADLRDESDRDGIRVVVELKRDAVATVVLNNLYKKTPLQSTFSGNFLAIMGEGTVPQRFTLRSALDCFLDFRFDTIRRKSSHQLQKVDNRAHIVDGLLLALESIDYVIDVIRKAKDQDTARKQLMMNQNKKSSSSSSTNTNTSSLSKEQADAVLKLQLGQLTRLNKDKLLNERNTLQESKMQLQNLLTNDTATRHLMMEEFRQLKDKFGIPRRTTIQTTVDSNADISDKDLIRNSRSIIVVTRGGYIKRMPLKTFESQRRGTRGKKGGASSSNNENDNEVAHCFGCNDHDTLLMTTQTGIAYGLRAFQIPIASRTAKGVPIPSVLPVKVDNAITSVLPVSTFSKNDEYCVLATEHGWIKKTPLAAFEKITSRGLTIATLEEGDSLRWCQKCTDEDDILIGSTLGKATRFEAKNVRPTGRTSRGMRSMKLKNGDTLADMNILRGRRMGAMTTTTTTTTTKEYLLAVTSNGYGKRIDTEEFRTQARGGSGVIAIKFKHNNNNEDKVSCLRIVQEDDEILVITSHGIIVRQKVKDIPCQKRSATGVMVQKVDVKGGDTISSVSIVPTYEETDDDDDENNDNNGDK